MLLLYGALVVVVIRASRLIRRQQDELHSAQAALMRARDDAEDARAGEERVPGQHEPRDPHADERRPGHDRPAARRRAAPEQRAYAREHPRIRRGAARRSSTTSSTSRRSRPASWSWSEIEFDLRDAGGAMRGADASRRRRDKGLSCMLDRRAERAARVLAATPPRLRQVLINLVGNAIKFTAQGGRIGVRRVRDAAERVSCRSECATPASASRRQRSAVFEPFMQADSSTTRRFGGTGLGLAICRGWSSSWAARSASAARRDAARRSRSTCTFLRRGARPAVGSAESKRPPAQRSVRPCACCWSKTTS